MDTRSKHLKLADLLTKVIVDFARDKGITVKEARQVFVSMCKNESRKMRTGNTDYDPATDPSHPMHGWRP